MRLLFVRHAQTESRASEAADAAAIDRHFTQEAEGGLSPRGAREAQQVAARLRQENLAAIYSSPLVRARETAEIAADALGMELAIHDALTELRTGRLREGSLAERWVSAMSSTRAPLGLAPAQRALLGATLIPLYFHAWRSGATVGGERPRELAARIERLFASLEEAHPPDATVALVTHGYLLVTLTRGLGARARLALARRPYIPNGAISEMELSSGRLRLVRHADARHVRGLSR